MLAIRNNFKKARPKARWPDFSRTARKEGGLGLFAARDVAVAMVGKTIGGSLVTVSDDVQLVLENENLCPYFRLVVPFPPPFTFPIGLPPPANGNAKQ